MKAFLNVVQKAIYNTTFMYNLRMLIAFSGTAFVPYFLNYQIATIPLTLGVVAAGISDIDDRFSVRILNLIYTYIGFFFAATAVQLLFNYPIFFGLGLIVSCIACILLGSLGRRYATIAYGCLIVSVYTMLGVHLFDNWYTQPILLVTGAAWYGIIATISFVLFPVRPLQDKISNCYSFLAQFLFAKSNLFDVDMTPNSYQQSMIDLSLENGKLVSVFNETRTSLLTRLKGDRGQKDTRRSLHYYFAAQDIHERADSAHINYQELAKKFQHSDILFRFQRILTLQAKACRDLSESVLKRQPYKHNNRFKHAFENLKRSLVKTRTEALYDPDWINALFALYQNLKSIDSQLRNLETEQNITLEKSKDLKHQLKDDDLKGWSDIVSRIKQNLTPESVMFRHAIRLSIVLFVGYVFIQLTHIQYGYWILLTALFVSQPNFNATKRRLRLRIIGTLVGIVFAIAVLYFVPSTEGQLLLLVISGVLFFYFRSQQYAQATAFITILALINFNLDGYGFAAGIPRFTDTLIGCGLAWLGVTFIWPDWKFRRLPRTIRRSMQAHCNYLQEIVRQYEQGCDNGLNYRVARRSVHNIDAELASLISTLATEPEIDPFQKNLGFEFLCLNHTFLSYIAALGAHREKCTQPDILALLEYALKNIQGALLYDEQPDISVQEKIQSLRQNLQQDSQDDQISLIILQQLFLIFSIIGKLSHLKQSLCNDIDTQTIEFGSL